ncbi:hypothetical protein K2F54_03500 [Cryobacterium sp. 1639]|uniref:hypothetical protein n=1 Tax=Cryobacterium inferilacus TaxID=2866629 RepID=UPI001C734CDE|nr:hypothetical protein [Cryobacterium sp. 1639]MBX0299036.1 hypothetical protein [Cryobacterium sp. 1639]
MNDTNRALNRLFIFVVGLILLVVGAAAAALLVWPWWANRWEEAGRTADAAVTDALEASPVPGTDFSWWLLAAAAVLLLLVILMVVIIANVGGGGSREIYRKRISEQDAASDRLLIDTSFAAEALKHSLDKRPDLVGSTVGAFTVKRRPVLHLGITPRQGVSPRLIVEEADRLIDNLARVVGDAPATCLTIHSGLRAKLGHDQRVR